MRERIESALTWLEDHGLLEYLHALFLHKDRKASVLLRDIWIVPGYAQSIDAEQQAAITKSLSGMTVNRADGTRARRYRLQATSDLQVSWDVFFAMSDTPQCITPQETTITEGMVL